jgi:hypothetical protein
MARQFMSEIATVDLNPFARLPPTWPSAVLLRRAVGLLRFGGRLECSGRRGAHRSGWGSRVDILALQPALRGAKGVEFAPKCMQNFVPRQVENIESWVVRAGACAWLRRL